MILIGSCEHARRQRNTGFCLFWSAIFLSAISACMVLPKPPPETSREEWHSVVVAPARFTPATNFEAFAVGKPTGAARGTAAGTGLVAAGVGAFAVAGGPLAVFIAPYLAVALVPAFAVGGGVAGYASSVTAEEARAVDALIQANLKTLKIQTALAELVADAIRKDTGLAQAINEDVGPTAPDAKADYRELAGAGSGHVLEIAATEVGFEGGGEQLQFFLIVRVRMIRAHDGEQLYNREFIYEGNSYNGKRLIADNAALLEAELRRAYESLAESITEQVFLLTALPLETSYRDPAQPLLSTLGGDQACGLAWRKPAREFSPSVFSDTARQNWNRFPVIATLTPTLEWEPFPRAIDQRIRYAPLLKTISNIRYDLRIWKVVSDALPQRVYDRRDLTAPTHTLDQPLEAGTRYFWSARARFDFNGKKRATRWGYYRTPYYSADLKHVKIESKHSFLAFFPGGEPIRDPCTMDFIPTTHYYRFETP